MRLKNIILSWGTEFGPIFVFFISSELLGFIPATALFVALTFVALIVAYVRERRVALFPLIAGFSVIVFGLLTVLLKNPIFLIVKDTIYNGMFSIALYIGLYFYNEPILKDLFGSLFKMTDKGWTILSFRWMIAFFVLAVSNEVMWRHFTPDEWLYYKMLATFATIVFGFYQLTLSRRERLPNSNRWGMNVGE